MVANILPAYPHTTLGTESVGQNSTLSEHGRVAYQKYETYICKCMVANILPADSEHGYVMLHTKFKRITYAATW